MLIIASDIHLGDGSCARSISANAFHLFAGRVRELTLYAAARGDGATRPVESIDVVLLGDILDPLHSNLWLDGGPLRPWSAPDSPGYAAKLREVTRAILRENAGALVALKRLTAEDAHPQARIHYMVGNHDWYYRLPGSEFDALRSEISDALGLSNGAAPFPWEASESAPLQELFDQYGLYAQHGDKHDNFNYDPQRGRNSGTLGDVFAMEVLNRYPLAVQQALGNDLPPALAYSLRELTNIRPALATSLWITSQIRQHAGKKSMEQELKKIWDRVTDEFLQVDFVRELDRSFKFDLVDALELVVKVSKQASFKMINDLVMRVRNSQGMLQDEISFARHALREPAFLDTRRPARYVVYGHTHHHEVIPLDVGRDPITQRLASTQVATQRLPLGRSQMYFNSGTWHPYFALAVRNPASQKFVEYQSMTYLTFYDRTLREHGERNFEAWSGLFA